MVQYLQETFGIKVRMDEWDGKKRLPLYLQNRKEYYTLTFGGETFLLLKMAIERFSMTGFEKQIKQLEKYTDMQMILWFDTVSAYQRQILIQNRIPFIVPPEQ